MVLLGMFERIIKAKISVVQDQYLKAFVRFVRIVLITKAYVRMNRPVNSRYRLFVLDHCIWTAKKKLKDLLKMI